MLKREITYEDFDGNPQTGVFYFNISKPEMVEMELEQKGGFTNWIQEVIAAEDHKTLIEQFKKLVLMSYGVRSDDGQRFIKSEQLREEFSQTNAYNVLFVELATDEQKAADFLLGIIPRDMAPEVKSALEKAPAGTPAPQAPTT